MVRAEGLEPPIFDFVDRRSIQLSYARTIGVEGFEPPTARSQAGSATRLRYTP